MIPMSTTERAAIIRQHLRAVPGLKKVSVRKGTGTAGSWIDVRGSGEFGKFTDEEREGLKGIGFPSWYVTSNGFNLDPKETGYWAERLQNNNTGFELCDDHYQGDGEWFSGWAGADESRVTYRIKHHGGNPEEVMAAAKAGNIVRVGEISVKWRDYSKPGAAEVVEISEEEESALYVGPEAARNVTEEQVVEVPSSRFVKARFAKLNKRGNIREYEAEVERGADLILAPYDEQAHGAHQRAMAEMCACAEQRREAQRQAKRSARKNNILQMADLIDADGLDSLSDSDLQALVAILNKIGA